MTTGESSKAAGSPLATPTLGELYLAQGHRREAAEIFQRVLEADPKNQRAREGLERIRGVRKPAPAAGGYNLPSRRRPNEKGRRSPC